MVSVDGKQVYSHAHSVSTLAEKLYLKCGNYDQTNLQAQ
jgi:hypothetical protein